MFDIIFRFQDGTTYVARDNAEDLKPTVEAEIRCLFNGRTTFLEFARDYDDDMEGAATIYRPAKDLCVVVVVPGRAITDYDVEARWVL